MFLSMQLIEFWRYKVVRQNAIAAFFLASVFILAGCDGSVSSDVGEDITTEELAGQPAAVVGEEVTVRSTVQEVIGDSVFAIDDQRIFGDGPILVINNTGKPFVLPEVGTDVQMTGEVMMTLTPEVEAKYNLNLDTEFYTQYRKRPVVMAKSLAVAPDPGEISENPEAFYGEAIAVEGEVDTIYGLTSFTLDEDNLFGGQDLLVLGVPASEQIEGQTVVVTGTLRPFVLAEFEKDYDFSFEDGIKEKIEAEFSERPVMVAEMLYPVTE